MYLHNEMEDMDGRFHKMTGVIDARAYRTSRLGRFGYITLTAEKTSGIVNCGESIKGHEFHYFDSDSCGEDMTAVKPVTGKSWRCVHGQGLLLAGFPHFFYYSNPGIPKRFLQACSRKESF